MRVAIDTNVLAYAASVNGNALRTDALKLLDRLAPAMGVVSVQALAELFNVLTRKAGWNRADARNIVLGWGGTFPLVVTSEPVILGALELATAHNFSLWDGIVVAAAAESGCRFLLTEDLQEGFTWRGVIIANPFLKSPNPLLAQILE